MEELWWCGFGHERAVGDDHEEIRQSTQTNKARIRAVIAAEVAAEREACAKLASDIAARESDPYYDVVPWPTVVSILAIAIRTRRARWPE